MVDHKPLTQADVGRVFMHGTTVPVMLLNHLGDEPFQVAVKCINPTPDGEYIVTQVDSRNLTPTSQRLFPNAPDYINGLPGFAGVAEADPTGTWVSMAFTARHAALLHSVVRESGWGYTEAGVPEVATELMELADIIRVARENMGSVGVKSTYADKLFDAQFEDVSDRVVILGVGE